MKRENYDKSFSCQGRLVSVQAIQSPHKIILDQENFKFNCTSILKHHKIFDRKVINIHDTLRSIIQNDLSAKNKTIESTSVLKALQNKLSSVRSWTISDYWKILKYFLLVIVILILVGIFAALSAWIYKNIRKMSATRTVQIPEQSVKI